MSWDALSASSAAASFLAIVATAIVAGIQLSANRKISNYNNFTYFADRADSLRPHYEFFLTEADIGECRAEFYRRFLLSADEMAKSIDPEFGAHLIELNNYYTRLGLAIKNDAVVAHQIYLYIGKLTMWLWRLVLPHRSKIERLYSVNLQYMEDAARGALSAYRRVGTNLPDFTDSSG